MITESGAASCTNRINICVHVHSDVFEKISIELLESRKAICTTRFDETGKLECSESTNKLYGWRMVKS